jgi:hypothetical protein
MMDVRNNGAKHVSKFCCILFLCKLASYYLHHDRCSHCMLFVLYNKHSSLFYSLSPAFFHDSPSYVTLNTETNIRALKFCRIIIPSQHMFVLYNKHQSLFHSLFHSLFSYFSECNIKHRNKHKVTKYFVKYFICRRRVVVQGAGPGPRYGHCMDLAAQRYLVTISGNDG